MNAMTLREVCARLGVSRRAVQGYEKAGLISPSGKNERGHLLYDERSQERIRQIKLFQQIGFSIREIVEIIDAPSEVQRAALKRQLGWLREEEKNIEALIEEVCRLIQEG
ncbi:MAG: MerR family transcriptional regulator [Bacteroidales bacterium]|nr:MerR family transcriptional regulator [Bacteroidales bacterium]MCM1416451.1 MerR family transcriptional regulator [bacterium]MCM1424426.1 MerR family transcriptional regulator [bacterium]